jgi:hypothetical protein
MEIIFFILLILSLLINLIKTSNIRYLYSNDDYNNHKIKEKQDLKINENKNKNENETLLNLNFATISNNKNTIYFQNDLFVKSYIKKFPFLYSYYNVQNQNQDISMVIM